MERGPASIARARQLPRRNLPTFSYSPVFESPNKVGGLLCAVVEDTDRVITSRRLDGLRVLATKLNLADSPRDVLAAAQDALAANPRDVPFGLIYLFEGDAAHLVGRSGFSPGHPATPECVPLSGDALWPVTDPHAFVDVSGLADLPTGEWKRPPQQAVIVPLGGQGEEPARGAIVVGLNPHLTPNSEYIGYLDLLAGQVASGLASAEAHDAARRRAADLAEAARLREEAAAALEKANAVLANEVEARTAERDRLRTLFQRAPGFMCSLAGPDPRLLAPPDARPEADRRQSADQRDGGPRAAHGWSGDRAGGGRIRRSLASVRGSVAVGERAIEPHHQRAGRYAGRRPHHG